MKTPNMPIVQLSHEKFTFEKYIGKVGFAISQVFSDPNNDATKLNPDVTIIGFCQANKLIVRPRPDGLAIMVEMDGEEFWFHNDEIPYRALKRKANYNANT